ncbi:MAG: hypothetical protein E6G56_04680 [Actinobacteria bacterium]|nr:MAG: hypothetical protein E6G56_04680 [Actinomycetota bacterium]
MSQENVEVVRQVFEAAARRDADAVLALYDPEVEWDATQTPGGLGGDEVYRGMMGWVVFSASGGKHGVATSTSTTS